MKTRSDHIYGRRQMVTSITTVTKSINQLTSNWGLPKAVILIAAKPVLCVVPINQIVRRIKQIIFLKKKLFLSIIKQLAPDKTCFHSD